MAKKRVLVIGLDCAAPQLVFERWKERLPNLRRLMESGAYGELESTIPPITCPAWMSMMTSKDPGQLGVYGFRNRKDHSYYAMQLVSSRQIQEPAVWDILGQYGMRSILVGVPPSYPPKPVHGWLVTCFLTPNSNSSYTHPPDLKPEIEGLVGDYQFDVENFRTEEKERILNQIYRMTDQHFAAMRHLMTTRDWDFAMLVEIGVDRIHHGFWKYFDDEHPKHTPGSPLENAIRDYYQYIDERVGQLLRLVDEQTTVLVVSDHGAKKLDGGICINEWLIQQGYLTARRRPDSITPFEKVEVDWKKTKAWGEGGYYARIFLNVAGREAAGSIPPGEVQRVREELKTKLEAMVDHQGRHIGTKVFKPEEIYKTCRGIPPDLIVYFGDLHWRSVGSLGHPEVWTFENDTGPDDANHAQQGIFIMAHGPTERGRKLEGLHLMDCAPTILHLFGIPIPPDMQGRVITP